MESEELVITNYISSLPLLIMPKHCTPLVTNFNPSDNVFIKLKITSKDTDGYDSHVYSGLCNVKLVDSRDAEVYEFKDNNDNQGPEDNTSLPVIVPESGLNQAFYSDCQSKVWIDPSNSPYVYNSYDAMESEEQYSIYHQEIHNNHIRVEQHNTYITQNVYNCNEAVPVKEFEHKKFGKICASETLTNLDMNSDEYECGVFLSQLPQEIIMLENENRAREVKYMDPQSGNNALNQLMSSEIQSIPKQQRTILYAGNDSECGETIQKIAVNDPKATCTEADTGVDYEIVIDSRNDDQRVEKKYQCDKCKQMFNNITDFKKHLQVVHETEPPPVYPVYQTVQFMCTICGKVLKNEVKFEQHQKGHGNPALECSICLKVFSSKLTLRNHAKVHLTRKHKCTYCVKCYHSQSDLDKHMGQKHFVFKCNICGYMALSHSDLVAHELAHKVDDLKESDSDATLSLDVDWLGEGFRLSELISVKELPDSSRGSEGRGGEELSDLTEVESDDAAGDEAVLAEVLATSVFYPYTKRAGKYKPSKKCAVCGKTFDRISDLKRHLIEHLIRNTLAKNPVSADGTLNIQCEVCRAQTFSKVDKYKAHLREHAKLTIYKCMFCDKSFSDSSNFSKHKKIHRTTYFQCDLCKRKFNSKKTLIQHLDYHNKNSPVSCSLCGKVFHFASSLNRHIKTKHCREVTRSKCRFCVEDFKSLKEKWDHEWRVHNARKMIVDCLICDFKFRKYSELKRHCKVIHSMSIPPARMLLKKRRKRLR